LLETAPGVTAQDVSRTPRPSSWYPSGCRR
jgi:hypothetical protein